MSKEQIGGFIGIVVTSVIGTLFEQWMMKKEVEEAVEKHFEKEKENGENN